MKRRWYLWAASLFGLGLLLFFPLRIALDASMGEQSLFKARQVAGSIWYGRIGEAMLGDERLGTFDVAIAPFSLLLGRVEADVTRMDDLDGPLSGRFRFGGTSEGVKDLDGRVGVGRLMAPIPVDALVFTDATILFEGARCTKAQGSVSAIASLGTLGLARELQGPLSCRDDGRLEAKLQGPRGAEKLLFLVDGLGAYEATLSIEGAPPLLATGLSAAGFETEGSTVRLTQQGRLR